MFSVAPFLLGGGEGGWKAPDSGGGGMGGGGGWVGGVSCEEFGVDNGGGVGALDS